MFSYYQNGVLKVERVYMSKKSSDGTKIYVGNSHSSQTNYSASGWFNTDEVLTSLKEVNICEVK